MLCGGLLILTHESATGVKDFRTIRRIFIHNATIAEFLNETFFPLDIGVGNIADLIRMEAVPEISRPQ